MKGINYKMNANTKRWSQLLLFVQNDPWLAFCTVAQVLPFYVAKIWRRIQKQEPHTKMWGTTLLHGTLSHLTSTCISCTHRPPPSLFSFLPFPSHFHLSLVTYWKKLTCGVIRSFDYFQPGPRNLTTRLPCNTSVLSNVLRSTSLQRQQQQLLYTIKVRCCTVQQLGKPDLGATGPGEAWSIAKFLSTSPAFWRGTSGSLQRQ